MDEMVIIFKMVIMVEMVKMVEMVIMVVMAMVIRLSMLIIVTKVTMVETVIMVTINIMVDMVIVIVEVKVVMVIRTDRTTSRMTRTPGTHKTYRITRTRDKSGVRERSQDKQIRHSNLTFQVTCVGQLSQFLRSLCF